MSVSVARVILVGVHNSGTAPILMINVDVELKIILKAN
jgi:hypothetical protein